MVTGEDVKRDQKSPNPGGAPVKDKLKLLMFTQQTGTGKKSLVMALLPVSSAIHLSFFKRRVSAVHSQAGFRNGPVPRVSVGPDTQTCPDFFKAAQGF